MDVSRETRRQIAAEAVDWFLSFQKSSLDGAQRQSFSEWLLRSPVHVEEYLQVSSTWQLLNVGAAGPLEADALVIAAKAHHESNVVTLPSGYHPARPGDGGGGPGRGSLRLKLWMALVLSRSTRRRIP
jgi:hypothetical protein